MRPESPSSPDPRIDDLMRRIAEIEKRLGIVQSPEALDRQSHQRRDAREAQRISAHPPVVTAPPIAPPRAADETGVFEAIVPPVAPAATPPAVAVVPPVAAPARAAVRTVPAFNLEKFIGLRLFAAVGALGLVIGAVLFLKLAIDSGWLRMPPAARCVSAAVFGFALLGAGEIARRKISALASAGLSAAGIGTIYGAVWFAFSKFELVSEAGAFGLLAASSALGIAVAARANLLSVAIVSLAGAYLAPIIAATEDPAPIVFPSYLLALVALGLGLSALRPRPFRPLRAIVWWATAVFGTGAAFGAADAGQPLISLAFLGVFWVAVHAELWHATPGAPRADDAPPARATPWRKARPIITTFGTTMWCGAVGVWSLGWTAPGAVALPEWSVTAALLLACGAVALVLAGNLRALVDIPRTDAERLGAALMAQAGALAVATVALALDGSAQAIAGVAIGVAGVFAGRWMNARSLDVYGLIVLALTLARLVLFDSWASGVAGPGSIGWAFLGLNITVWTLLMLGAAAGWGVAGALLVRRRDPGAWRSLGIACIAIAMCVAYGAFLSPIARTEALLVGGVLLGGAAFAAALALGSTALSILAMIALGLMSSLTLTHVVRTAEGSAWPWAIGGLVLSRWGMVMLLAAAVWTAGCAVMARWARTRAPHWLAMSTLCATGAAACCGLAFLAPGTDRGAVAWVWLAIASGILALHLVLPRIALDVIGLTGVGASVMLWFVAYALGDWNANPRPILLHHGLVLALAQTAAFALAAIALHRRCAITTWPQAVPIAAGVAIALAFAATSLEVRRAAHAWVTDPTAQHAALSIWWGLYAIGLIVAGFVAAPARQGKSSVAVVRHAGLALMTLAAIKVVIIDSAEVADLWRIVVFLGLGLMMLGVAIGYAKVAATLDRSAATPPEKPG
ncbi:MAG: DUF2339 domain-containing protein [Phycisphaeraceae bacterium]|nr:DUF2339 domain-containing protein [Phycisphaeraceae bacterium]